MDVILLFMKLEDKYWGIFLAALLFLFTLWMLDGSKEMHRKFFRISLYGVISYLVFLCPLTYRVIIGCAPELSDYYPLSHAELVVPVLVTAGTAAVLLAEKEGKRRGIMLLAGLFLLLAAAGDFAYLPREEAKWQAECDAEEKEAFDLILSHAERVGDDGKARIWGMEELMAKCRLYDASLQPVYGKDMAQTPERYGEGFVMLHKGYASYDVKDGTAINIGDQLDALAGLPYLFPETDCEYVVLYEPSFQFEDYKEYFKKKEFDAVGHFSALGYDPVGRTEHLLVFYKQEG